MAVTLNLYRGISTFELIINIFFEMDAKLEYYGAVFIVVLRRYSL